MNRHLHRVIFNHVRGQRMVVQETASSTGKANGATSMRDIAIEHGPTALCHLRLKTLAFAAVLTFGVPLQFMPAAVAQIVVDTNAPKGQQPTLRNTANGLPQVNITAPSAAGVSRNTFTQFDIQKQGAILNNSRTDVQTQLGGYVQGNAALAGGSARVILNEINSPNATQLRGFVEVAGPRAEVIIANPSGIYVNGGGFINATSATLTTGTPLMNNGKLDGFLVQKGAIRIDGAGLDSRQTDYTGILARAIEINAGIWANKLKLVAGVNQVSADQSVVTAAPGQAIGPAWACATPAASMRRPAILSSAPAAG
jgi:filamentous hemagglutinin